MRVVSSSIAHGAVLIFGVSCWAQDQPAAGSPPPAQTQQAPAQTTQQPAQAQQAPDQNAAPAQDEAMPPAPIDARRAPNPRRQARMLARKLGLTPEQRAQIEPILADRLQQVQSARADATLAPRERRAAIREANRDSVRKVNAVLTDAQRQEYKQLRQEQRARRQGREQQHLETQPPATNPQ